MHPNQTFLHGLHYTSLDWTCQFGEGPGIDRKAKAILRSSSAPKHIILSIYVKQDRIQHDIYLDPTHRYFGHRTEIAGQVKEDRKKGVRVCLSSEEASLAKHYQGSYSLSS
jgi:hypothetical protein